jgi:hypothetical protein
MPFVVVTVVIVLVLGVVPAVLALRFGRAKVVSAVAALVTVTALTVFWRSAWSWTASDEVLDSIASVDGDELVVRYVGGECEDQRSVDVDEDDQQVRIAITSRSFASACSDVGVGYDVAITLDEPLGTREVVNENCTPDRLGCQRIMGRSTPR